ncbi:MAG: TonB-dependent receptor plug domain-containing protein [Rhodospirillaceae bacterium]|nr:TonB-dependent receptor plug domain-containing protein [Rhodospirillaceae bacterium]
MNQDGRWRGAAHKPARARGGKFNLNLALLLGGAAIAGAGHAQAEEATPGTDWQKRLSEISSGDALRMDTFVTQVAQTGGVADFNIPAQPLGQALIAFSEATGIAVIADAALIVDLTSSPLTGTLTPDQALATLLGGTGLGYRQTADNTVTLERSTATNGELAPLSVEDSAEAAPPLSEGYQPLRIGSNKYTQPLVDTPQTIVVVPQKVLKDRGQSSLRDAIKNVPGVTVASGEGGTRGNTFRIRGFEANRSDNSVDGLRDNTSSSFRDVYNIEQILGHGRPRIDQRRHQPGDQDAGTGEFLCGLRAGRHRRYAPCHPRRQPGGTGRIRRGHGAPCQWRVAPQRSGRARRHRKQSLGLRTVARDRSRHATGNDPGL